MSTDIKFSKAQIFKIIPSGRYLGSLLSKVAVPLIKVAVPLAKYVLAPSGITAVASVNTWFWKSNFNNFKWRNECHNEN